jgi:hypothetical protein
VEQVNCTDGSRIFHAIKHEQPQTISLLLSFLAPKKASEVLVHLDSAQRDKVIARLATLAPASADVVETLAKIVLNKIETNSARGNTPSTARLVAPATTKPTAPRKLQPEPQFRCRSHLLRAAQKLTHRTLSYAIHG